MLSNYDRQVIVDSAYKQASMDKEAGWKERYIQAAGKPKAKLNTRKMPPEAESNVEKVVGRNNESFGVYNNRTKGLHPNVQNTPKYNTRDKLLKDRIPEKMLDATWPAFNNNQARRLAGGIRTGEVPNNRYELSKWDYKKKNTYGDANDLPSELSLKYLKPLLGAAQNEAKRYPIYKAPI